MIRSENKKYVEVVNLICEEEDSHNYSDINLINEMEIEVYNTSNSDLKSNNAEGFYSEEFIDINKESNNEDNDINEEDDTNEDLDSEDHCLDDYDIMIDKLEKGIKTPISNSNKGFKMIKKLGYKEGETLGKNGQGLLNPIEINIKYLNGNKIKGRRNNNNHNYKNKQKYQNINIEENLIFLINKKIDKVNELKIELKKTIINLTLGGVEDTYDKNNKNNINEIKIIDKDRENSFKSLDQILEEIHKLHNDFDNLFAYSNQHKLFSSFIQNIRKFTKFKFNLEEITKNYESYNKTKDVEYDLESIINSILFLLEKIRDYIQTTCMVYDLT